MNPPGFEEWSSRVEMVTVCLVDGESFVEASGAEWAGVVEKRGAGLRQ